MPDRPDALERLNALPHGDAVAAFLACCASPAWAETLASLRPFADIETLLARADLVWAGAGEGAWWDAFDGHPRLGEATAAGAVSETGQRWSAHEQAGVRAADADTRAALATAQRDYEARFGHIFLICATGLGADEVLDALRARLHNDAATELRVAAEEQRQITRLRLERMVGS